jgi:RNA polymerase sigma factor (sigma-70 family)
MADGDTRPSLLIRIRDSHDVDSWRLFVEIYAPLIYRSCRRRGLQDADAADVGQEVLAQVARSIRSFEYQADRGRFRDWLGSVVRSKVARFLEKSGRTIGVGGSDGPNRVEDQGGAGADPSWVAEFQAHVLAVALERVRPGFEPQTWTAFERVWKEGRPALETAGVLGMSIDSVYLAKSRILRRLREEVVLLAEDFPLNSADPGESKT